MISPIHTTPCPFDHPEYLAAKTRHGELSDLLNDVTRRIDAARERDRRDHSHAGTDAQARAMLEGRPVVFEPSPDLSRMELERRAAARAAELAHRAKLDKQMEVSRAVAGEVRSQYAALCSATHDAVDALVAAQDAEKQFLSALSARGFKIDGSTLPYFPPLFTEAHLARFEERRRFNRICREARP
jgi:hypothetical protein